MRAMVRKPPEATAGAPAKSGMTATEQSADPAAAPVPFRSYLIRPLRRAPDGSVLMPGTDAPAYPTPAFPTAENGARVDQGSAGAVYAYGPPTQPSATATMATPQRSYLIPPLSRSGAGTGMSGATTGGTVVQPETLSRAGGQPAPASHSRLAPAKPKHHPAARKPKPGDTGMATPANPAPLAALANTAGANTAGTAAGGTLVVQAGAFSVRGRAEQVAQAVGGVVSLSGRVWRVRCGPFASRGGAEAALARAKAAGYSEARIQRAD